MKQISNLEQRMEEEYGSISAVRTEDGSRREDYGSFAAIRGKDG
jgi:hypothetical protein